MQADLANPATAASVSQWLRTYYFLRAGVSILWIALALVIGGSDPTFTAVLLVAYPAWDALANYIDAKKNGGFADNSSQAVNAVISIVTAIAVAIAFGSGINAVFVVFGAWAALSGLLQLLTGVRRWKTAGAQWAMILSGAQSALAGGFFIFMAIGAAPLPGIGAIVGYAGFGAFYFLVSAIWLTVKAARRPAGAN